MMLESFITPRFLNECRTTALSLEERFVNWRCIEKGANEFCSQI